MAFAFPPSTQKWSHWWSVVVVDPEWRPFESVPYIHLKYTTMITGYPFRIFRLLQPSVNSKIDLTELIARMLNVCMIEAGFIPIRHGKPALNLYQIQSLSVNDRLARLIYVLEQIVEEAKTLRYVQYTFIRYPKESLPGDTPDYIPEFSLKPLTLTVINDENEIVAIGCNENVSKSVKLDCSKFLKSPEDFSDNKHHALHFVYNGEFNAMKFVQIAKCEFIYEILDNVEGAAAEIRGFNDLSEEILEKLASHLDGKSLAKFISTSRRHNRVLDSDVMWKKMYKNAKCDLRNYGFELTTEILDESRELPNANHKMKYVHMYLKCKGETPT